MKRIWIVFCFMLLAAACDKDEKTVYESEFAGNGNRIVSFALVSTDGERFPASIKNDEIVITLPSGLDMEGVKPEYRVSEHAVLQPNPNNISDWLQEYRFLVTSYSTQSRVYQYRVNLTGHEGNLKSYSLKTQEEVDAFAESGVTEVLDLTIGTTDGNASKITNLKGLSKLKKIVGKLVVWSATFTGENLDGLYALESVGTIEALNCSSIYLPALKSIAYGASFSGFIDIDLPELIKVGGQLSLSGASRVELIKVPKLETVAGKLLVKGGWDSNIAVIEFPELVSVYELELGRFLNLTSILLPELKEVYDVRIDYGQKLSDFSVFAPFIPLLDNEHWKITRCLYNPTYQDMVDGKYTNHEN